MRVRVYRTHRDTARKGARRGGDGEAGSAPTAGAWVRASGRALPWSPVRHPPVDWAMTVISSIDHNARDDERAARCGVGGCLWGAGPAPLRWMPARIAFSVAKHVVLYTKSYFTHQNLTHAVECIG